MQTLRIVLLLVISIGIVSCGGSKKIASRNTKTTTTASEKKITKQVSKIENKETVKKLPVTKTYSERVQNYIDNYSTIAKDEMRTYGIPASITLAQGILESGAGYGDLTSRANNHFGIKCHDWKGDRVYHDDDRLQECFRKYDHPKESFRDHSLFLKNRKRYAKLFTYKIDDYKSWAYGLRSAGYATDKKYPAKLINIIQRYGLDDYDQQVLGKSPEDAVSFKPEKVATPVKKSEISKTTQDVVNSIVDAKTYVVLKGDTLYSISKKYNLSVNQLKAYNNIQDNTISIGQVLKIKPSSDPQPEEEEEEF